MLHFEFKNSLITSIFIALFFASGCAMTENVFDDLDGNGDGMIEREEFDQALTDSEYFSDWDTDGDGVLTEEEWSIGIDSWGDFGENIDLGFSDWDLNGDSEVTEDEFGDGFFGILDDDDNDTVDQDEWDLFNTEVGDIF